MGNRGKLIKKIEEINAFADQRVIDMHIPSVPHMHRIEDDRLKKIKEVCEEYPCKLGKIISSCFDMRFKHNTEQKIKLEDLKDIDIGAIKLSIIRGNFFIEIPCDVCGLSNEIVGVYDIALDLPVGIDLIKFSHQFSEFICPDCSSEIAPELLRLRNKLRESTRPHL